MLLLFLLAQGPYNTRDSIDILVVYLFILGEIRFLIQKQKGIYYNFPSDIHIMTMVVCIAKGKFV